VGYPAVEAHVHLETSQPIVVLEQAADGVLQPAVAEGQVLGFNGVLLELSRPPGGRRAASKTHPGDPRDGARP